MYRYDLCYRKINLWDKILLAVGIKKWYGCYIKSHCESPDYENYCIAYNKDHALNRFVSDNTLREFNKEDIADNVSEE